MYLLGIDIGTSSCKVALYHENGDVVGEKSKQFNIYYPKPGFVEQDADEWWEKTSACIKELIFETEINTSEIAAIGIAGQSWSAIPIDNGGSVLGKTPIWMDTRAAELCKTTQSRIGEDRIFSVSGNPFSPSYTLPKILYWAKHNPELIKRTDKFLQSNSFIAYRLTGAISQDLSQSYAWHNFNIKTLKYDEELSKAFGIDPKYMIEPVTSDTIIGHITKDAEKASGLKEGTPVVAGGLDAACGTLGVGVIRAGQTQEQGGQAGGMSICLDEPGLHPKLILGAHVIPDKWLLQGGTVAGGASIDWLAKTIGAQTNGSDCLALAGDDVFKAMSREAENTPPGSNGLIFLPYLNGERSPVWDCKALGMYMGLALNTRHGDMVRAAMEGVAYSLKHNIETAREAGAYVTEMRPMGGSAKSQIWTQIKSDITGKKMVVPASDTATTSGAAMLAGIGVGVFNDYEAAVKTFVTIERHHQPNIKNMQRYNQDYDIYKNLYSLNKDLMHKLYSAKGGTVS